MVNLGEILGENRRFYEQPMLVIKKINFSDIIVTSPGKTPEDVTPGAFTDPNDPSNPGVELGG